ncbi:FtsX-like permease family protein [Wenzhouxiangella sp. XN201]|uniref:FtsX-like permease family protein n=1 Tax=Wenzhouxiangella sp. XN201 TaxID=2710755 RepID=UPI0013C70206|nr:FtsX-like permease family protein [Wenzhouxiangella sp. XN201]NEZ03029.1 FtsX-like permease family protein [Wenzhouxiangella sp. XN201]
MRLLLQSSRRFFRRHPGQLMLALAGMAAGVAVMTGVALMRDVLVDSLDGAATALAGEDSLRISAADGPLDEAIYAELATRAGSPTLLPVLAQTVRHRDRHLELLGVDLFGGGARSGRLPPGLPAELLALPDAVAVSPSTLERLDLEVGDTLPLRHGRREITLTVSALLPEHRGFDDRLLMDIAAAQDRLDRSGELSWIDAPATARDWLNENLPEGLELRSADARRSSAARLTEGMRANLSAMGLISLAVGLFVIFSVLSFLLVQRRRALAMLRAVGVTHGRIALLLLSETAVIAGLGALAGLVLGTVLADALLGLVRDPVASLYDLLPPARVMPTTGLYLALWGLAVGMALISMTGLLREARGIPPGQLLRRSDSQNRDWHPLILALGLLALALAVIGFSDSLPAAFAGLFLGLAGCALLAPVAGLRVLRIFKSIAGRSLVARALALLLAGRRRIGPPLAALGVSLALAAGIAMMVMGFRAAVDDWIDRLLQADSYVTASRGALDPERVARICDLPDIAATTSARRIPLEDGRDLVAYDLHEQAWRGFEWLAGDSQAAWAAFSQGQAVVISEPMARRSGLQVGDTVEINAANETLERPIAAIYRDYASERGSIAIHAPLYRRVFDDPLRDSIGLYYADPPPDRQVLLEALAAISDELRLTAREQVRDTTLAVFDRTFRISWALAALVGLISVIALVSALLALGLERRRDYATLRALGLTPARLYTLVIAQTAGLALAAALVAVPIALAIHLGLSLVVQPRAFGWSLPLSWPLLPAAALLPLAVVCGVLAGLYPAWRIGRRPPARELRGD